MTACLQDRTQATPLWLTAMQDRLLVNAECVIQEGYCANGCVHRVAGRPCFACPDFDVPAAGYVECSGYRQGVDR